MNSTSGRQFLKGWWLLICLWMCGGVQAQTKIIKGVIRDQHSGEAVPFASVDWKASKAGILADSAGTFLFHFNNWPTDTLQITSVGYEDFKIAVNPSLSNADTLNLLVQLVPGKFNVGVVVRSKTNRGRLMWKRIVAHKPQNDRYRFQNFSYEL